MDNRIVAIAFIALIGGGTLFVTYPMWSPVLGAGLAAIFGGGVPEPVKIEVAIEDGLTDAAWSPAGASVIAFWSEGGEARSNTLAETPDGTFTSTARILEFTPVTLLIKDSGSGVWTRAVDIIVPNINTLGVTDPTSNVGTILMYPHSATTADDISLTMLDSAGAIVSNASAIGTGEDTIQVVLSIAADKSWGNNYYDPQTMKTYIGGLFVLSCDPTKLNVYDFDWTVTYGSVAYWVWEVGALANDGDYAGDESLTFFFRINALSAGASAIDINFYPEVEYPSAHSGSFGTSDVQAADVCIDIEI